MGFKIINLLYLLLSISNILKENATYQNNIISKNYLLMIWII